MIDTRGFGRKQKIEARRIDPLSPACGQDSYGHRHFVEGRLQPHEYDERVALAYQAVTYADLAGLFTDLPADNPIGPPAARESTAKPAVRTPAGSATCR